MTKLGVRKGNVSTILSLIVDLGVIKAKIISFSKKQFLLSLLVSIARPGFSLFSERGLE